MEAVNDTNEFVYNFFLQMRENPRELIRLLENTPYSYTDFYHCMDVARGLCDAGELEKARAFFVCCNLSFAAKIGGGWARTKASDTYTRRFIKKVNRLNELRDRMKNVYIENKDALEVIDIWDHEDALFYLDPPYPGHNQAHYLSLIHI